MAEGHFCFITSLVCAFVPYRLQANKPMIYKTDKIAQQAVVAKIKLLCNSRIKDDWSQMPYYNKAPLDFSFPSDGKWKPSWKP